MLNCTRRRIFSLPSLAVAAWASCLGFLGLLAGTVLARAWHPHFLPATAMLLLVVVTALALVVGASWRIIRGQRRRRALSCLLKPVVRLVRARFSIPSLVGVVTVRTLVPPAAQSEAPVMHDAAMEDLEEPPKTDVVKASLPSRALLRIGTNDLRTQDSIMALAFSPDGRLIAAAEANAPSPRVALFDVRTGQRAKQILAPGSRC
jgi:hypothetical protein